MRGHETPSAGRPGSGHCPVHHQLAALAEVAPGAGCGFSLGFKAHHDEGPDIVGDCLSNETTWPDGRVVQPTTGGLLVWDRQRNISLMLTPDGHAYVTDAVARAEPDLSRQAAEAQVSDPLVAVAFINALRQTSGVPAVELDSQRSAALAAPAAVLAGRHYQFMQSPMVYDERSLPAGVPAGLVGDVVFDAGQQPLLALEAGTLDNAPLHAADLLDPALKRIGLAAAAGTGAQPKTTFVGMTGSQAVSLFDTRGGLDTSDQRPAVVPWPAPEAHNVAVAASGEEPAVNQPIQTQPWPEGRPVSLLAYHCTPDRVQASLAANGQALAAVLVPATATVLAVGGSRPMGSPFLVPMKALEPATWYTAHFHYDCGGQTFDRQWRFLTASKGGH